MSAGLASKRPVLDAFDAECAAFAERLESLTANHFDRPTNCPPWTLHELVVHVVYTIRLPEPLPRAPEGLSTGTAADYYHRPERDTVRYRTRNVESARSIAATVDHAALSQLFADAWKRASETFAAYRGDERIEAGGRALSVDSYLLTRLMSVVAHGVDVAISLARPAWTTTRALRALRPVLVDLLGSEPPSTWTDQDLLEIGTGRRSLSETDREELSERAALFPLLS